MPVDLPWVAEEAGRRVDEERVAALVGRSIAAVRYVELDDSGWPDIVGRPIEAIEAAWEPRLALCSRSWILRFAGDRQIVLTLGDRDRDGRFVLYVPDNVAVFFSLEAARRHGALVPAE